MTKKKRKLILIRNDLLEKAAKITAKEGKTMFAFTNETFENAIKAYDMQTNLNEILELYSSVKLGKSVGMVMLPATLLDYMLEKLYNSDRKNMIDNAYKSGVWLGRCLLIKFPETEVTKTLENIIKKYMWDSLDLSITDRNETVELRCVSPALSKEKTEVIFKFIEGTFNALNYKVIENNCFRGIISMKLERSSIESQKKKKQN